MRCDRKTADQIVRATMASTAPTVSMAIQPMDWWERGVLSTMSVMRMPVRESSKATNAVTAKRSMRTATYSSRRCFRSAATDFASRQGSSVCFADLRCTADMAKHVAAPQTATDVPSPGPSLNRR